MANRANSREMIEARRQRVWAIMGQMKTVDETVDILEAEFGHRWGRNTIKRDREAMQERADAERPGLFQAIRTDQLKWLVGNQK